MDTREDGVTSPIGRIARAIISAHDTESPIDVLCGCLAVMGAIMQQLPEEARNSMVAGVIEILTQDAGPLPDDIVFS